MLTDNNDILRYAVENGMLDVSTIRLAIENQMREEILKQHNFSIYYGKDEYWHTYTQVAGEKRKQVKKRTKEKLLDYLIDFYNEDRTRIKISQNCFKARFDDWVKRQELCCRSDNTIDKYKTDYKRFFENTDFEIMEIQDINETHIMQFLITIAPNIKKKAMQSLIGYLKGVFQKAIRDKLISKEDNPLDYVDFERIYVKCKPTIKKRNDERIMSNDERKALLQKLEKPIVANYNYVVDRAVELSLYTGMRVGEISALKWTDFHYDEGYFVIERSEKYSRKTKKYYIDDTKNHKIRTFPITKEIKNVLEKLKTYQEEHKILDEYLFVDESGKVHTSKISDSARNKTMTSEFKSVKSIHCIRRTLNSNLRGAGVSATVAAALLGHTERVNDQNYTYDTSDLDFKLKSVSSAGKIG